MRASSFLHIPVRAGALTPITQTRPLFTLFRAVALLALFTNFLFAADSYQAPFACKEDDIQWAGMTCTERDPCPIYLDISHVHSTGQKILAAGNIHSAETTLYSILLESENNGLTWREPVQRVRGGELDDIQFVNADTGWISGQRVAPLPGDPFLLFTNDGGKTWRKQQVLPEGTPGFIQKFWFSSPEAGALVIDRGASDDDRMRYTRYETSTGGDAWTIRESSEKPLAVGPKVAEETALRIRGDAAHKALLIERRSGSSWTQVAMLKLELAQCTGEPPEPDKPPPAATDEMKDKPKDYVKELVIGGPPAKKKP